MTNALLIAFAYLLWQVADNWLGWQTFTRPLVLCTLTGLMCGDITTGVIIGAELEAVYMGVSAIGGEAPSNYQAASVLAVGFVVLSGADQGVGLALAVTVGTLINAVKPFTQAIALALHPWFMKIAETGNVKKFRIAMWLQVGYLRFSAAEHDRRLLGRVGRRSRLTDIYFDLSGLYYQWSQRFREHAGGRRLMLDDTGDLEWDNDRHVCHSRFCRRQISGAGHAAAGVDRHRHCLRPFPEQL